MIKLYYFAPHPIQYNIGLFRELNKLDSIDFKVFFEDRIGIEPVYVEEFDKVIKWDSDLLSGYKKQFLINYSSNPMGGFFSRINPSIVNVIFMDRPDAVILHGYVKLSDWIVFFTCKILGIKIIFRGEASIKGNEKSNHWKQRFKRFLLPKFFNACDAIMYSCTGNKKYWEFYKVPKNKMFPLPCAVDNNFFRSEMKGHKNNKEIIKKNLGIDNNDMVVLFSGRFTNRKRPLDLLKAITKIDNSKITLLFVGDGTERKSMFQFSKKYNIKAKFVGFINQSELSKYYSISDLVTVISDYDPSPKVLNEVMNFELPVIVTNVIGTAYDLVQDGINGFIIQVGDIDNLATKINYFNNHRYALTKMGMESTTIVSDWNFEKNAYWITKALKYTQDK